MSDTNTSQNNGKVIGVAAACLIVGGAFGYLASNGMKAPDQNTSAAVNKEEVVSIVKEVLNNNPELIVESLQGLQKRAYERQMAQSAEALKTNMAELKSSKTSPVIGPEDAPLTVVEFFDYHCGYCKRMTPVIAKVLENHKDVKFVMKEFPILSQDSQLASRAALAVSMLKPNAYFDFHQKLINHKGQYSQEALNKYAKELGISADALQKAMQDPAVVQELESVKKLAESIGVQGTPGIIIGEELIPGAMSYEDMEFRLKALREMQAS